MLILLKERKLILALIFLLISHLVSWASRSYAELEIINKTKNYWVWAEDIELDRHNNIENNFKSEVIEPGNNQKMSWYNGALSKKNSTVNWYSKFKFYIVKKGQNPPSPITINLQPKSQKIENVPVEIDQKECFQSVDLPFWPVSTYRYCDYVITVGTGTE